VTVAVSRNMKTQSDKSSWLAPLITGITVVLFSSAGIARMMGWGPGSSEDSGDMLEPDHVLVTGEARARPRCPECGVIVSVRQIERRTEDNGPGAAAGAAPGNGDELQVTTNWTYEITVRMSDGSSRVVEDANPAEWRTGERLIVIGGVKPSSR